MLKITGSEQDVFEANIFTYDDGLKQLATSTQQLAIGESMTLQEGLPNTLNITRTSDCDKVIIQYAGTEDLSFFPFNTRDRGYKPSTADGFQPENNGSYCLGTLIEGGRQFDCW